MKKTPFILFFIFIWIFSYSQTTNIKENYNIPKTSKFADSLQKTAVNEIFQAKEGLWIEDSMEFIIMLEDTSYILELVNLRGYYINNKKEGIWDVYLHSDQTPDQILAQLCFHNDSLLFSMYYEDCKIRSIFRETIITRSQNNEKFRQIKEIDSIFFNKDGSISKRLSYTPDNILENINYNKMKKCN